MAEFTLNEKLYRSSKMNAFQQFHVARKLGPIFTKIGPGIRVDPDATVADMISPVAEALAHMPEEDCNYILHRCLAVVQRFEADRWAPVWNDQAKRLMFEDIDLSIMIQITLEVLGDNLGNFINAPSLSTLPPATDSSIPN